VNLVNVFCRLLLIDVVACFSWLLTLLACGWIIESVCRHAFIVRLTLTSVAVAVSSCSLVVHVCSSRQSKLPSRLSWFVPVLRGSICEYSTASQCNDGPVVFPCLSIGIC